jgi:23S rRNA (cytidine1920-2'-O)/16S rRNA (cytidine1409-2'-O)-methyltransferase
MAENMPSPLKSLMAKIRLDQHLVQAGFLPTREKAQAYILAGRVWVGDKKIDKCGTPVDPKDPIRVDLPTSQYVSRGGDKLAGAFSQFPVEILGKTALDVGISTGGFTDYLFQQGIKKVVGIDVGYGQVDYKIRMDPRLHLIERTNARHISAEMLAEYQSEIRLVVMDVSFISVTKILPNLAQLLHPDTDYIILIKPQFESQKSEIGKGGIIKDETIRQGILDRVTQELSPHFQKLGECNSPITGTKGNQEAFFWLKT